MDGEDEQLTQRLANLLPGDAQIVESLLNSLGQLSTGDRQDGGIRRAPDAHTYLDVVKYARGALLPPMGYEKGEGPFVLEEQRLGIKVCRRLDFSLPGHPATDLWHYCSLEALNSFLEQRSVERVGNLFVDSLQPSLLASAKEARIYCTSCEPMSFEGGEAIQANRLQVQMEASEGEAEDRRSGRCQGPMEVAIPVRVNIAHLAKEEEVGDSCWSFCPEEATSGRRVYFDSLSMLAVRSVAQGDGRRLLKMLLDGSVRCDHRLSKEEAGPHFEGIGWLSLLAVHKDDAQLFRALEACGAQADEIQTIGHAAEWGRLDIVRLLAPQSSSHEKDFALKAAARFGHAEVVELLLEQGASNVEGAWRQAEDQRIIAERELPECAKRGFEVSLEDFTSVSHLFAQYAVDPRLTAQQRGVFLQKAAGDFSPKGLSRVRQELAQRLGKDADEEAQLEREGREAVQQEKQRKQDELSRGLPPGWRVLIGLNERPFYYYPGNQNVKSGYERPVA